MNPNQLKNWESLRRRGRKWYILVVGVLCWGLLSGLVWAVAMSAMQGWERLPLLLALGLVGFPIGGYFFGAFMWKRMESEYQKSINGQQRRN
jgi:hypothetical protein